MAEISREYKYNRLVFDKNAQSWTEKYANPAMSGTSGWSSLDNDILAQNNRQIEEKHNMESLLKASNKDCGGNRHKMQLLGKKLSLKSEGSEDNTTTATGKQDLEANHLPSSEISTNSTACLSDVLSNQNATVKNSADSGLGLKKEYQGNGKNMQLQGQRFSSMSEAPSKLSNCNMETKLPNHLPTSASNIKNPAMQPSEDVLENGMTESFDRPPDSLYRVAEENKTNLRSLGQKMLLKSVKAENGSNDKKEDMAPYHLPSLSGFNNLQKRSSDALSRKNSIGVTNLVQQNSNAKHILPNIQSIPNEECNHGQKKLHALSKKLSLKSELPEMESPSDKGYKSSTYSQSGRKPQKDAYENATPVENLVVLDSEDSADESERPSRSKLSLMRRRLAGKFIG